jgi:hypothetical protein
MAAKATDEKDTLFARYSSSARQMFAKDAVLICSI